MDAHPSWYVCSILLLATNNYITVNTKQVLVSESNSSLLTMSIENIPRCILHHVICLPFGHKQLHGYSITVSIQVKEKYDTVARLWKELPTNEELMRRQALTEEQLVRQTCLWTTWCIVSKQCLNSEQHTLSLSLSHTHTHTHTHTQRNTRTRRYVLNSRDLTSNTSSSTSTTRISSSSSGDANITDTTDSPLTNSGGNPMAELTEDEVSFCTRFQLSHEEVPLPSWRAGRRCSLLDRNRPLSLTKSGKLFLTHRYM